MKIKFIAIGVAVLFIAALTVTVNIQQSQIKKKDAENARLQFNQLELSKENSDLTSVTLRKDEVIGKYKTTLDSALERLNLRPKEVLKIVDRIVIQKETDTVKVYVTEAGQDNWFLSDTGNCFLYEADVYLTDKLEVWRSNFEYENKITDTFYKKRPKKFLFIRYGKWTYFRDVYQECGTGYTKEVTFIK